MERGAFTLRLLPFSLPRTHPIFGRWQSLPTIPKSPAKPRNRRRQVPRRRVPTCGRSGLRLRNCSIPRSIAAKAGLVPRPACSRRRIIPGTAAPAARPPPTAPAPRPRARVAMWRGEMRRPQTAMRSRSAMTLLPSLPRRATRVLLPPLPPRAKRVAGSEASEARSRGRGWGVDQRRHCPWGTPLPNPPPQGGREQKGRRER
jgi:hypothetical protein